MGLQGALPKPNTYDPEAGSCQPAVSKKPPPKSGSPSSHQPHTAPDSALSLCNSVSQASPTRWWKVFARCTPWGTGCRKCHWRVQPLGVGMNPCAHSTWSGTGPSRTGQVNFLKTELLDETMSLHLGAHESPPHNPTFWMPKATFLRV